MRLLLLAVCFILTACASTSKTDGYLRTTGVGNTYEEAKNNAFKEAIEYRLGVVIASERETYNNRTKEEILAYSS
jgi:Tfp pilus assembly protein PilZ